MTRLRRLGNPEIENVVADLLGRPQAITRGFLADSPVISESRFEELGLVAERVAAKLTDAEHIANVATCASDQLPDDCAHMLIADLTRKLWGRPADGDEVTRLTRLYRDDLSAGHAHALALLAEAILLSPHFVYRTELGAAAPGSSGGETRLTGAEIASAISFLVHGGRPDAALLDAGLAGQLHAPDKRSEHAARLLNAPGGRRQMARFIRTWLGLEDVAAINKDLAVFPAFTPAVRFALDRELSLFLDHVFTHEGGRLDQLFLADYTFAGPAHASVYGPGELLDPIGDFSRVRLDASRRRGLLASPAFLARHALIGQTNPVERGLIIRNRVLCQDIGAPPPEAQATTPAGGPETTTRSKYEAHVHDPACRSCHQFLDGLGFGLEQFDAIGRYRTHEGVHVIDASGQINGTDVDGRFVGAVALSQALQRSAQVRRCFVEQLWQFSLGREALPADQPEIDYLAWQFVQAQQEIPQLILAMIARPNFILRTVAP